MADGLPEAHLPTGGSRPGGSGALALRVPVGRRVLVAANLRLDTEAAGTGAWAWAALARALDTWAGPGTLVLAGGLGAGCDGGGEAPGPTLRGTLEAHPRLAEALAAFRGGEDRRVIYLPGGQGGDEDGAALAAAGIEIAEVVVGDWEAAYGATTVILESEAAASNRALLDDRTCRAGLGATVRRRLEAGAAVEADRVAAARGFRRRWQETVAGLFGRAPVLALPTVPFFPPPLGEADGHRYTTFTNPFNLAGVPALSLPVPTTGPLPAGLQLVAPAGGEELLLATAAVIEAAVGPPR